MRDFGLQNDACEYHTNNRFHCSTCSNAMQIENISSNIADTAQRRDLSMLSAATNAVQCADAGSCCNYASNERFKVQNAANSMQLADFNFKMPQIPCKQEISA